MNLLKKIPNFYKTLTNMLLFNSENKSIYQNEILLLKAKHKTKNTRKSILFFTTERAASRYVAGIMQSLANDAGMTPIYFDGYFSARGEFEDWLKKRKSTENVYKPLGYLYGPIRICVDWPAGAKNFPILLNLRDPRDMLVSLYYNRCYEISSWAVSKKKEKEIARGREKALKTTIDEFVISEIKEGGYVKKTYNFYCEEVMGARNTLFLKYEDMVEDFNAWFNKILDFFQFNPCQKISSQILQSADFKVAKENIYAQKRQVTPGDYKRKLTQETINILNIECENILDILEYSK